jgi:hypothetical protein
MSYFVYDPRFRALGLGGRLDQVDVQALPANLQSVAEGNLDIVLSANLLALDSGNGNPITRDILTRALPPRVQIVGNAAYVSLADGNLNTFVGDNAGALQPAERNTFVGAFAGEASDASTSRSVFVGAEAGRGVVNALECVFVGSGAGKDSEFTTNVVAVGSDAFATTGTINFSTDSVFIGKSAGQKPPFATNRLVVVGAHALSNAESATAGIDSVLIGANVCAQTRLDMANVVVIGSSAMEDASNVTTDSVVIGSHAAQTKTHATDASVIVGKSVLGNASGNTESTVVVGAAAMQDSRGDVARSVVLGANSGNVRGDVKSSVCIGTSSLDGMVGSMQNSVCIGADGMSRASGALRDCVLIGSNVATSISRSSGAIVIGQGAGGKAFRNAFGVIVIGTKAGESLTGQRCTVIGEQSCQNVNVDSAVVIGSRAINDPIPPYGPPPSTTDGGMVTLRNSVFVGENVNIVYSPLTGGGVSVFLGRINNVTSNVSMDLSTSSEGGAPFVLARMRHEIRFTGRYLFKIGAVYTIEYLGFFELKLSCLYYSDTESTLRATVLNNFHNATIVSHDARTLGGPDTEFVFEYQFRHSSDDIFSGGFSVGLGSDGQNNIQNIAPPYGTTMALIPLLERDQIRQYSMNIASPERFVHIGIENEGTVLFVSFQGTYHKSLTEIIISKEWNQLYQPSNPYGVMYASGSHLSPTFPPNPNEKGYFILDRPQTLRLDTTNRAIDNTLYYKAYAFFILPTNGDAVGFRWSFDRFLSDDIFYDISTYEVPLPISFTGNVPSQNGCYYSVRIDGNVIVAKAHVDYVEIPIGGFSSFSLANVLLNQPYGDGNLWVYMSIESSDSDDFRSVTLGIDFIGFDPAMYDESVFFNTSIFNIPKSSRPLSTVVYGTITAEDFFAINGNFPNRNFQANWLDIFVTNDQDEPPARPIWIDDINAYSRVKTLATIENSTFIGSSFDIDPLEASNALQINAGSKPLIKYSTLPDLRNRTNGAIYQEEGRQLQLRGNVSIIESNISHGTQLYDYKNVTCGSIIFGGIYSTIHNAYSGIIDISPTQRMDIQCNSEDVMTVRIDNFQTTTPVFKFLGTMELASSTTRSGWTGAFTAERMYAKTGGNVSNPVFSFASDRTTGMFQPSANVVAFSTNGIERLRIGASSGNVDVFGNVNANNISTLQANIIELYGLVGEGGPTITGAASTVVTSNLSPSKVVISDENGKLANAAITTTELGYLSGVTSAIQTQLDDISSLEANVSEIYTDVSSLEANVSVLQANVIELYGLAGEGGPTITGAASTVVTSNLAADKVVVSDASGKIANAAVTTTELSYLDGVTSAIQTQLDAKVSKTGDTMTGQLTVNGNIFTNGGGIEVGGTRTSEGPAFVDLTTQPGADFNARIIRASGVNGNFNFEQAGTGNIRFFVNGSERFRIQSDSAFMVCGYLDSLTSTALDRAPTCNALTIVNTKCDGKVNRTGDTITGTLSFGSTTRQMLNLWGTGYALGVQNNALYLRSGGTQIYFYGGGVHDNTNGSAGTGGTLWGTVSSSGFSGSGSGLTNLNATNLTTGTVTVARGGTGVSSLTANKLVVGAGTGAVTTPTNLHWDGTNSRLGIGTTTPGQTLTVAGTIRATGIIDSDLGFHGLAGDSRTTPSFSFSSDTSTGMYRITTSTIGFSTGGIESMRITPTIVTVTGNFSITGEMTAGTVPWGRLSSHVSVSPGNGLTGGGALNATRTLTLGTPTTLSGSTTNSTTDTSHTHAILHTSSRTLNSTTEILDAKAMFDHIAGDDHNGTYMNLCASGSVGGVNIGGNWQSTAAERANFLRGRNSGSPAGIAGIMLSHLDSRNWMQYVTSGGTYQWVYNGSVPTAWNNLGTTQMSLSTGGTLTVNTTNYPSDRRIKEDITDADTQLCHNVVKSLPLRRYKLASTFLEDMETPDQHQLGFIADEVAQVFPKSISEREWAGYSDFKMISYDQLYKCMWGALQETIKRAEDAETRLAETETRLAATEASLAALRTDFEDLKTLVLERNM